jgi:hypothetical protein
MGSIRFICRRRKEGGRKRMRGRVWREEEDERQSVEEEEKGKT